jgi:hypothetical protein
VIILTFRNRGEHTQCAGECLAGGSDGGYFDEDSVEIFGVAEHRPVSFRDGTEVPVARSVSARSDGREEDGSPSPVSATTVTDWSEIGRLIETGSSPTM